MTILNVACVHLVSACILKLSMHLCVYSLSLYLTYIISSLPAGEKRLLWMRDTGNTSLFMSMSSADGWRGCFFSDVTSIQMHQIPASSLSVLRIQSMFNLFLFLNRVQLAFIALPFQSRVGANLFSVDIKGQFMLLFRKYFSDFS